MATLARTYPILIKIYFKNRSVQARIAQVYHDF